MTGPVDKSGGNDAIKTNADYSDATVTPAQRGHFQPMTGQGEWAASYADGSFGTVENAHDQAGEPTHAYEAPLDNNATPLTPAPVADR